MIFHVLTLFPGAFTSPLQESILKRAQQQGLVEIQLHHLRDYTHDRHRTVDDYPYGGGAGMVMKPEPLFEAVEAIQADIARSGRNPKIPIILLTPQGRLLNQPVAKALAKESELLLICGHYEGMDERVREHLVTDEISIGDYVLTGGELAALVIIDAVTRLLPGVLDEASLVEDSHAEGLLEYPQYTRPAEFRSWSVPEVLLSGNHAEIARWRRQQTLKRTAERRPDLLEKTSLSASEQKWAEQFKEGSSSSLLGQSSQDEVN